MNNRRRLVRRLLFGVVLLALLLASPVANAEVQHRVPPGPGEYIWSKPWAPAYVMGVPGFIDFEGLSEGEVLGEVIPGVKFTTTEGQDWLVGTWSSNKYNGKYPSGGAYTSQGDAWAWLGASQGGGIIEFTEGKATYFSCLVSTYSGVRVDAYDENDVLVASSGWATNNLNTGTMDRITVTSPYRNIKYVVVHDSGNYWLIDCISTDAPGIRFELAVPLFKQTETDPDWYKDDMVPGKTIGTHGCAMTSAAMVLRSYGEDTIDFGDGDIRPLNPRTLNEWLIREKGYEPSGDIKWHIAFDKLTEHRIVFDGENSRWGRSFSWDSAGFSVINSRLEARQPVILHVRGMRGPDEPSHFVVARGKVTYDVDDESKNYYLIRDPSYPYASLDNDWYNNQWFGYRLFVPGDGVIRPLLIIRMYSPAEMLITDSFNRRTGYDPVTYAILEEIPGSRYYEEGPIENLETGEIGIPTSKQAYLGDLDSGLYELTVFGTGTGSYLLTIDSRDSSGQHFSITLDGTTYPGKVDEYLISYSNTAAEDLVVTPVESLQATVEIDPETLNLRARGRWITACIGLPEDYAVEEIDVETVKLVYGAEEPLGADWGDVQNGILMVKFDRAAVARWFENFHDVEVELTVTCRVTDSLFAGTATIRVINP